MSIDSHTPVNKLKILIVDDDNISNLLLENILKVITSQILKAHSGNEGVELFKANSDIDLIMMDIKMPGMDGYQATKLIREISKDVIIIAETAFALTGDEDKALAAGCNNYISKPIISDKLFSIIKKHFDI
ncbi:MAG TPA: response regulator [Tenuifilaceae bacterium]|nr:response regulator [Tenuifilaceae bacterium]HRX31045.1 response regulator [Tenuifilaceae bacterium]